MPFVLAVGESIPRLSFVLDDLRNVDDEALERRALGVVPTLTLCALRNARSPAALAQSLSRPSAVTLTAQRRNSERARQERLCRRRAIAQVDPDPCTAGFFGFEGDAAAVGLDDLARDRQA